MAIARPDAQLTSNPRAGEVTRARDFEVPSARAAILKALQQWLRSSGNVVRRRVRIRGFDQPWLSEADAAAARNRTIASGALVTRSLRGEVGSRPIRSRTLRLMNTDLLQPRITWARIATAWWAVTRSLRRPMRSPTVAPRGGAGVPPDFRRWLLVARAALACRARRSIEGAARMRGRVPVLLGG